MISFKQYITEMAFTKTDETVTDEVMTSLKDLGDTPILWRGQTVGRKIGGRLITYSGVIEVTNDRGAWRGGFSHNEAPSTAVKLLKLKNEPIFTTFDKKQSRFFGNPGVVVPIGDFKIYWNPEVHDLATHFLDDDEPTTYTIQGVVDGYKSSDAITKVHDGEVILDCKSYYWITPNQFYEFAKKSKFNTYKDVDDIKTYADLYQVYKGYMSYLKWYKSR
jgi:hypothetical protein